VVLADDNFASIAHAVEEGRTVYDNLKKTITFLLPVNGGESLTLLLSGQFDTANVGLDKPVEGSAALADGKLGAGGQAVTGLKVLLRESHIAWAAYEAAPGERMVGEANEGAVVVA
jgi:hypothetical protein